MLEGCGEEHRTIDLRKNARAVVDVTCEHTNAPTTMGEAAGALVSCSARPNAQYPEERLRAVRCYAHCCAWGKTRPILGDSHSCPSGHTA
jgi:hypothetical protein